MNPTGIVNEHSPLNDSPLCAECNLSITDGSYILWKGRERVCTDCRNIRVEQLRKTKQEFEKAKKRKGINGLALSKAVSATVVQLKAREKWDRQMIYLEAKFSDGARTQRIRYLFAKDIPIYLHSWLVKKRLYLQDVAEAGNHHRECRDCGQELALGEGIQWNYAIRLCNECHSERKRTMKFGVYISPSKLSLETPLYSEADSPRTRAIKLVAEEILITAGGSMGIILFNEKMQKMGYLPDDSFKMLNPDPRFIFIKSTGSRIVEGKTVRTGGGDIICIWFKEEE